MRGLAKSAKLLTYPTLLLGLVASSSVGCAPAPSPRPSPDRAAEASQTAEQTDAPATPQPTQDRAGYDECMAAAGYRVVPGSSGSNAYYAWERSSSYQWDAAKDPPINPIMSAECVARFGRAAPKTIEEQRVIYDRWILERRCLLSLGFHPHAPPSFQEFYESWSTGPWSPIDGVPFDQLAGRPRELCGLEMIP